MEELDVKEIFGIIWNKKKIVIAVTILFVILAAVYSFILQTPKYQSSITLVLTKAESATDDTSSLITANDLTLNQRLVSTYSEIIKSESVLEEVISDLEIKNLTANQLKSNITVTSVKDSDVIKITVSHTNPKYAAKIANRIGEVFAEKVSDMYKMNNMYTLDVAKVASTPYNVNPAKYIIIAFLAGIILSCGIIIMINVFDTTVKTADGIEKALKVPVIAEIPNYDDTLKKGAKKR